MTNIDHDINLALLFKYLITIKKIKASSLKMKDLTIELENLRNELSSIKESLTTTKLNKNQILSLDDNDDLKITWINN